MKELKSATNALYGPSTPITTKLRKQHNIFGLRKLVKKLPNVRCK